MKCTDCDNPVDLKAGDEITADLKIAPEYGEVELCRACFAKGWSLATIEEFQNDPGFMMLIPSPIQRHDI